MLGCLVEDGALATGQTGGKDEADGTVHAGEVDRGEVAVLGRGLRESLAGGRGSGEESEERGAGKQGWGLDGERGIYEVSVL